MKKLFSFLMLMFATVTLAFAEDPVTIASGTFNGKNATYTDGWTTTGTGVSRTDCIIIGNGENITSPEVDLSLYESITINIKARRYGTLSGSKAQIAVTFEGEDIGSTVASSTSATTSLDAIEYEVSDLSKGSFVFICSNSTSAGSTHGAGINSIVITGVKKTDPTPAEPKFYITGDSALVADAAGDATLAWNPAAIKSDSISYKLNLKANQDYKLKVTVDGTWNTAKGFDALTTVAEGLAADEDGNICFSLNTESVVSVHYDGEFFFLNGDFYVAPAPEKKYFLKNNWDGAADWTWKEMTKLDDGTYELVEVVFGGTGVNLNTAESDEGAAWIEAKDIVAFDAAYEPAVLGALDTVVFYFDPEAVNQYTGDNGMTALIIGKYIAPVVEDGYYLVGKFDGVDAWSLADLTAEKRLALNLESEIEEYELAINLAIGDELKVIKVENSQIDKWFPAEGGNYVIDDHHNGATTLYFRPNYDGGEKWFAGCIYVVPTSTVDINNVDANAPAVKIIRNGQIMIIKGEKAYNAIGLEIR